MVAWIAAVLLTAGALRDLIRTEDAVSGINRSPHMRVCLAPTEGAPAGNKGRAESAEHSARLPSFAEQERLPRELARQREEKNK